MKHVNNAVFIIKLKIYLNSFSWKDSETATAQHKPSSAFSDLLSSQFVMWWDNSCLGIKCLALKGQVFSSPASLGWFWNNLERWSSHNTKTKAAVFSQFKQTHETNERFPGHCPPSCTWGHEKGSERLWSGDFCHMGTGQSCWGHWHHQCECLHHKLWKHEAPSNNLETVLGCFPNKHDQIRLLYQTSIGWTLILWL